MKDDLSDKFKKILAKRNKKIFLLYHLAHLLKYCLTNN